MKEKSGPPTPSKTFHADAMYYHAAQRNLEDARHYQPQIEKAERKLEDLKPKEETILQRYDGDKIRAAPEAGEIWVEMAFRSHDLHQAYGPFLQHLVSVHFFCAACLEAHINAAAHDSLEGRVKEEFFGLSFVGKWLYLPRLLGAPDFNPARQPFQDFQKLVGFRNHLTHYKRWSEEWTGFDPPDFLKKLGLSFSDAQKSIQIVPRMVIGLAERLKEEPPQWLVAGSQELFRL